MSVVLHNGSKYDNHLMIKQLAKDFNGYFSCISENTEKVLVALRKRNLMRIA